MYRRCLIALFFAIYLIGCTAPAPQETVQDPNVTPEGIRITPDVVCGHIFGMALTFDMYQPQNSNGAGVLFINSGGWQSPILILIAVLQVLVQFSQISLVEIGHKSIQGNARLAATLNRDVF